MFPCFRFFGFGDEIVVKSLSIKSLDASFWGPIDSGCDWGVTKRECPPKSRHSIIMRLPGRLISALSVELEMEAVLNFPS